MKKILHILSLKLSELWISSWCSANSWKSIFAWEGQSEEPAQQSFFTQRLLHCKNNLWKLWSSEPVINALPLFLAPFVICSEETVAPAAQLQWCPSPPLCRNVESNAEPEPCPGHRTGILGCPSIPSSVWFPQKLHKLNLRKLHLHICLDFLLSSSLWVSQKT